MDREYEILDDPGDVAQAQAHAQAARRAAGLPAADVRVGTLADDPYLRVERHAVRFPDGTVGLYNRLLVPAGTVILPVLADRVLLIDRFRHGTRAWHLEAPRGSLSGDASPEECARRELAEEIGAQALDLVWLGKTQSSTGCSNEVHDLFLARVERYGKPNRHESIRAIRAVPLRDVEGLIMNGAITDGPTLTAFLFARLKRLV